MDNQDERVRAVVERRMEQFEAASDEGREMVRRKLTQTIADDIAALEAAGYYVGRLEVADWSHSGPSEPLFRKVEP